MIQTQKKKPASVDAGWRDNWIATASNARLAMTKVQ